MEQQNYTAIVEGLLFAAGDEGLTLKQLAEIMELEDWEVESVLSELKESMNSHSRGLTIMQSKQHYHLTTKPDYSYYFQRMVESPQASRLSQAALETLAIIAYQQPITRTEVEEVRGVKSERPIQTLVNRNLVEEQGRKDAVGRPRLYGTTRDFLTYFGLTSIEELPPLPEELQQDAFEQDADLFFESITDDENKETDPFQ
ncbi:segregation and condensation protein B [Pontibacillus halophilus JSM 076056 = DSM 19796]|uniref:Segregation and condensation protein B n=1 Tax=Pontibacillus halophilus JSM 076056 = DSM 19796 TaxID=1385510 RepID=A0A0A5I8P7_9BACI|nr:SMC-Scp complex subunit ScpB [Pontibacillus halophilus]KGX92212.1 segregation and condensation protein B [Pontibacillus halophilus JSM 076056 = DSM 19796]